MGNVFSPRYLCYGCCWAYTISWLLLAIGHIRMVIFLEIQSDGEIHVKPMTYPDY
jgi:hypothetical protein